MSKCYTLEEVKSIRDKISKLGERKLNELEATCDKAEAEYDKAEAEHFEHYGAEGEYSKTEAELDRIAAERNKAKAERNRARAECEKVGAEYDIKLFDILISICPKAHYWDWRGYITIPKSENEEWIIPVFAGDFNGIKVTVFSVWTMPKESCDEKDAREVKEYENCILEEVRAIKDKISKLGEGSFDELREELSKARAEWHEELQKYRVKGGEK